LYDVFANIQMFLLIGNFIFIVLIIKLLRYECAVFPKFFSPKSAVFPKSWVFGLQIYLPLPQKVVYLQ